MINGTDVSFRPDLNALIGPEFIPIEVVERIEIARGPLSALYGANAFLATVNVVTIDPDHIGGRVDASGSARPHNGGTALSGGAAGVATAKHRREREAAALRRLRSHQPRRPHDPAIPSPAKARRRRAWAAPAATTSRGRSACSAG